MTASIGRQLAHRRVVVLLGAPGAGKGTQAQILSERLGLAHVATGDLFRAAVRDETPLGLTAKGFMDRGELVPDAVTIEMLLERLAKPDAAAGHPAGRLSAQHRSGRGPRQGPRRQGRPRGRGPVHRGPGSRIWSPASAAAGSAAPQGHPYHEQTKPPTQPGVCDVDGSELYQRDDDKPATVQARLRQQLGALDQVVDYYRGPRRPARPSTAARAIEKVTGDLLARHRPGRRRQEARDRSRGRFPAGHARRST